MMFFIIILFLFNQDVSSFSESPTLSNKNFEFPFSAGKIDFNKKEKNSSPDDKQQLHQKGPTTFEKALDHLNDLERRTLTGESGGDVSNEEELYNTLTNASITNIMITSDILISKVINITSKNLIIYGNNFTFSGVPSKHETFAIHGYYSYPQDITFQNLSIINCGSISERYTDHGGGIYIGYYTNVNLISCKFKNNVASYGGAIFVNLGSSVIITDSIFINNIATISGAGIFVYLSWISIFKTSIEFNYVYHSGGGFSSINGNGIFNNVILNNNNAKQEFGGAIFSYSNFIIQNCIFNNNYATYGPAVGIQTVSEVDFYSCQFNYNQATNFGGSIVIGTDSLSNFINCEISHNIAVAGGAIAINYGTGIFKQCIIYNNSAISELTFNLIKGNCIVSHGCFSSSNYPSQYPSNDYCMIQTNSNLDSNNASLDVISFFTEPSYDELIINNISYSGLMTPQCLNVNPNEIIIWKTNEHSNYLGFKICLKEIFSGGGGIYISGGSLTMIDSLLKHNHATRIGGTLQIIDGDLELLNCTITTNSNENNDDDISELAPINYESGTFTAVDLILTGEIEGTNAVISNCNSACGVGMYGNCSTPGSLAPDCYVNCECLACEAGKYSNTSGAHGDICEECETGKSSNIGSSSCDIAASDYYLDIDGEFVSCPDDATCKGGLEMPRPNSGYWIDRSRLNTASILNRCHRSTCIGASSDTSSCWLQECYGSDDDCSGCDSDELQCRKGSEGPLCGSCSHGYSYSSSAQTCLSCNIASIVESSSLIALFIIVGVMSVGCGVYYFYNKYKDEDLMWINMMRRLIVMLIHKNNNGVLRVLWVNYQIIDSVSWTLEINFPFPFKRFLFSIKFFVLADCLPGNYLASVFIWSLFPFGCALINEFISQVRQMRINYLINHHHSIEEEEETDTATLQTLQIQITNIKNSHFANVLLIFFILLPPIFRKQFVALNCFDLLDESYLRIDTSVDCNSNGYVLFVIFDVLAIAIYSAVPLYWILLLYQSRSILNPPATDEQLVYYIRDNDRDLDPLRSLFTPYRPSTLYFESFEMFRRVLFIGVLPLVSSHSDRRAALGMLLSLCSLELFRSVQPFRSTSTNILAYVAQYAILLTFGGALLLETSVVSGLSEMAIGGVLFAVNILVLFFVIILISLNYLNEKKKSQQIKEMSATKVEWAITFDQKKFQTTFDSITEHTVPPSSVLCFWYCDVARSKQVLKSGIPARKLEDEFKNIEDVLKQSTATTTSRSTNHQLVRKKTLRKEALRKELGGIVFTLHGPKELDAEDKKYFPTPSVLFACSIPRKWLIPVDPNGSLRVVTAHSLQALRCNYFGEILEPRPWFEGGVLLPPKAIRRAYLLQEEGDELANTSTDQVLFKEVIDRIHSISSSSQLDSSLSSSSFRLPSLSLNSNLLTTKLRSSSSLPFTSPKSMTEFLSAMTEVRNTCAGNGWAPVYHYTQPLFGQLIAKTGFRMSTQGQGDGGVYFSTKGPCSYGLGTEDYEKNIIIDCFGKERLDEYKGKGKLDILIIYGVLPQILSPAPGGRDNAVMVKKSCFEAMTYPHADGNYFLRSDRILGMFCFNELYDYSNSSNNMIDNQILLDIKNKKWIDDVTSKLKEFEQINLLNSNEGKSKRMSMYPNQNQITSTATNQHHELHHDLHHQTSFPRRNSSAIMLSSLLPSFIKQNRHHSQHVENDPQNTMTI